MLPRYRRHDLRFPDSVRERLHPARWFRREKRHGPAAGPRPRRGDRRRAGRPLRPFRAGRRDSRSSSCPIRGGRTREELRIRPAPCRRGGWSQARSAPTISSRRTGARPGRRSWASSRVRSTPRSSRASRVKDGIVVETVTNSSPAGAAGIVPGDIIVAFDGQTFTDPRAVPGIVTSLAGRTVNIDLIRAGQPLSVTVQLNPATP